MTINSLKDLDKLLKLLRSQGVKTFELNGIKLELGDAASVSKSTKPKYVDVSVDESLTNIDSSIPVPSPDIPTDTPTAEELLFWSTGEGSQESMTE